LGGGDRFKIGADRRGETEEKESGREVACGSGSGCRSKKAITKIYDAGRQ
jgi:hypothetical protein